MTDDTSANIIDGIYVLKKKVGKGGMATVYLGEVDLLRFDYTTLYAYTQVQGKSHTERRTKAEVLAKDLRTRTLDLATMRSILEAQSIPTPGKQVAVKVATGGSDPSRFEGEWKNLLCLNHPNVVEVYGGGVHRGRPYYIMELLDAIITPEEIKAHLSIEDKLRIVIQGSRGLQYLHDNGLIHRDVKPDNMVTCRSDGGYITKITDLGLGKAMEEDLGLTATNTILGSPSYMSPEQITCTRSVDHRADIYSMGASLYELVCGFRPYHNKSTVYELISCVTQGEKPVPVEEHAPYLPKAIIRIIDTAMEFKPEDRYDAVSDLADDLETYIRQESTDLTSSLHFEKSAGAESTADVENGQYKFEHISRTLVVASGDIAGTEPASEIRQTMGDEATARTVTRERGRKPGARSGRSRTTTALLAVAGVAVVAILLIASQWMQPALPSPKPQPSLPPETEQPVTEPEAADLTEAAFHKALGKANPAYAETALLKVDGKGIVTEVAFTKDCKVEDLTPVKDHAFKRIDLASLSRLTANSLPRADTLVLPVGLCHLLREKAAGRTPQAMARLPLGPKDAGRAQAAAAEELGLPGRVICILPGNVRLEMALIPAAHYGMGMHMTEIKALISLHRTDGAFAGVVNDCGPQRPIQMTKPFYMAVTETTRALWNSLADTPVYDKPLNLPADNLTYTAIDQTFMPALRSLTGREESAAGFDLPSEAQWELACRAGSQVGYYSGDSDEGLEQYAWFARNSNSEVQPVGTKRPNAWGLYDMHGNVWEWCRDWFNPFYYRRSPRIDPENTLTGIHRVLRGGSVHNHSGYCRSAFRGRGRPTFPDGVPGFRLVFQLY